MAKYKIALVAEFESGESIKVLGKNLELNLKIGDQILEKLKFTTLEIEEIDYPKVDLTKV